MPRFNYVANETNSENTDGICTVLYFDEPASREEIQASLRHVQKNRRDFPDAPLVSDPDDEFFDYKERATPLSAKAGWHRYECYGSC